MSVLRYVRPILWSFAGIRRGQGAAADTERLSPVALVLTAIGIAAVLVLTLVTIARFLAAA